MDFAYQKGYLDNLLEIYPIKENPKREMPPSLWKKIKVAYSQKDVKELIKLCNIGVKSHDLKFPIECYYASSLRNEKKWIDLNPTTVNSMGKLILNSDIDVIFDRCTEPKKVSRQVGPMFSTWFVKKFQGFQGINLLGTSDSEKKQKAEKIIGYRSKEKGLDIFIQLNKIFIIGEAKFITDAGGTQANQFRSALYIVNTFKRKTNVIPLSIVDGHCWRKANDFFYRSIKNSKDDHIIISALLLEELFDTIGKLDIPEDKIPNNDIIKLLS